MVQKKFSKEGGQAMSRDEILQLIRKNAPVSKSLPDILIRDELKPNSSSKETFKNNLIQVGAEVIELNGIEGIAPFIAEHYPMIVDFSKQEVWTEYNSSCPKEKLEQLETILLEGQFGVAENGAIWLDEINFPNRLVPFITQKLIIKLDKAKIVGDMHHAYRRINLSNTGFGVFISGPSKTADIEQCLVYGAHGPKILLLIIY